jgi:AbrB family looped-hinge helix DNA binding protein
LHEVRVDSKHRVVLSEEIRQKSGIKAGSKLRVIVKGTSIVLAKNVEPNEFIGRMQGILKDGSPVHTSEPLKLKEI